MPIPEVVERPRDAADAIDDQVIKLFAMVMAGLAAATEAFLSGDKEAARALIADDQRTLSAWDHRTSRWK